MKQSMKVQPAYEDFWSFECELLDVRYRRMVWHALTKFIHRTPDVSQQLCAHVLYAAFCCSAHLFEQRMDGRR